MLTKSWDDSLKPYLRSLIDKLPNFKKNHLHQELNDNLNQQRWYLRRRVQVVGLASLLFISILATFGWYTYVVAQELRFEAAVAQHQATIAYDHFKNQDLLAVQNEVDNLTSSLKNIKFSYGKLSIYLYIPVFRNYYQDGLYVLAAAESGLDATKKSISALTPYADVLGFSGEETFEGGTAEDRLALVLDTLDLITPELDAITEDLEKVEKYLSLINPNRYPEQFRGTQIRARIIQVQEVGGSAKLALNEYRPVIEQLPAIAGGRGERKKYLILFQNDNELRPTGGFLTAYAIINIENGKVEAEKSDDIYELDRKKVTREPIPEALGRYLTTERYFNLRDMNISPDFETSMSVFFEEYIQIRGEPDNIDGIIAVDTEFLTSLMNVLGPIEVPGYGTFTAEIDPRCDCPQIIYVLSEIITRPTPYLRDDRKGILGPLMRALLTKAYGAPKQQWPELFEVGLSAVQGRHLQAYFIDQEAQTAASVARATGKMIPPESGDFLAIINANLGGAKSNLFTEYSVTQLVNAPVSSRLQKTVEITYRNPRKADNCNLEAGLLCLNSTLRDWTRLYIPEGSSLIEAQGFTQEPKVYDEAGFTVIDGFFILEPLGTARLKLTYEIPYDDLQTYALHVWKQGGIVSFPMLIDVEGGQEEIVVNQDIKYQTIF